VTVPPLDAPAFDERELIERARAWRDDDPDPVTRAEIDRLLAAGDFAALADRFAARLEFGTAGLRGPEGAGPNRMNRAMVRKATAGFAAWLRDTGHAGEPVIVGRDGRHGSEAFAADAAAVLAGAGLRPLAFPGIVPTPVVAYAVRTLNSAGGIVVTASHNPAPDNGYKVYAGDGAQIVPPMDHEISARIDQATSVRAIPYDPEGVGEVPDVLLPEYVADVTRLTVAEARDVKIAYTPMHGVGRRVVERVLSAAGFPPILVVASQADPDPDFPTVPFPNPEEPGAMDELLALASAERADLAIANDPDADRLAVAVPDAAAGGRWRPLTGDEIGSLLGDWRLERDGTGRDRLVATTIVSSSLLSKLAAEYHVSYAETLTGFKWLARAALAAPRLRPVYAYEEALGSCVGSVVRDKDGISAAMAFAEMAATERARGRSVLDRLDDIYQRHGVHATIQRSIRYEGSDAVARAQAVVDRVATKPPVFVGDRAVTGVDDLRPGLGNLPPSDVVRLHLEGARVIVRPSGTEPKLKAYIEVVEELGRRSLGDAKARAKAALAQLTSAVEALVTSK
jgi:phosphomannomutase